ncbi:SPOR domain-containing protein [Eionea flava]
MSQDFAKNKRSTTPSEKTRRSRQPTNNNSDKNSKKKSNTRRTQTKNNRSKNSLKKSPPLWAWIIIGGCLIGFGFFLTELSKNPSSPSDESNKEDKTMTAGNEDKREDSKVKFDFYEILKGKEVNVDERIVEKTPEQKNIIYFLQAGSFKQTSDADTLRAKLILQGLPVDIETTSGKDNQQWHRVVAGPFNTRSQLAKARSVLASNEINSIVIKRKKQ